VRGEGDDGGGGCCGTAHWYVPGKNIKTIV